MYSFSFNLVSVNIEAEYIRVERHIFRAVFLEQIMKQINEDLKSKAHESKVLRQYAIKDNSRYNEETQRRETIFTINVFDESLSNAVLQYILNLSDQTLIINQKKLLIQNVEINYMDTNTFKAPEYKAKEFVLNFETPTYFRKRGIGYYLLFPEPLALFTNLVRIWNTFVGADQCIDMLAFRSWVEKNIYISSYELRTKSINFGKGFIIQGFVGWARFKNNDPENEFAAVINTLCRFAEYSNVGGNRSAGYGAVSYKLLKF